MSDALNVLYITTVPSPYKVALFEEIGKIVNLTVLFELSSVSYRNQKWFDTDAVHFESMYMHGLKKGDRMISVDAVRLIRNRPFDAIIIGAYSTVSEMLAQQYLQFSGTPYILSSDGGFISRDSRVREGIKRHFIGNASYWLSPSALTTKYLVHYGANPRGVYHYPFSSIHRSQVLQKPITIDEKKALRDTLGISARSMILSIGQMIPRKGFDLLVKAAARLPELDFFIIGGKPTDELLALQQKLRVGNVQFLDFKGPEELDLYYSAADVFALPTREDVWGLVINEAMAHGLPVVTSNRCGAGLEMVTVGKTGSLIPVDDVDALTSSIEYWAGCPSSTVSRFVLEVARHYTIEEAARYHVAALSDMVCGDDNE